MVISCQLAEGQKRAADMEKRRLEDKGEKIRGELAEVVERGAMDELVDKYLLSGDQETQKVCCNLICICNVSHLTYDIILSNLVNCGTAG